MSSRSCRGCGDPIEAINFAPPYTPVLHDEANCLASKLDRLEQLLATAYQLAGLVGAPVRFLDAYSRHEGDIDSLLPVDLSECDEFTALQSRLNEHEKRESAQQEKLVAAQDRLDSAEKRLREACCVDHKWRASTFIEYSTPHWVCNNCGKAEGKKYDEWYSQVRTASGAASNRAVLSNESAGPHSEAAPVVERQTTRSGTAPAGDDRNAEAAQSLEWLMRWFGWFRCRHEWLVHFVGRWFEGVECIKCGKTDFRPHGHCYEHPAGWLNEHSPE